ncbi:MAG: hypothetical protein IJ640_00080 [Prevotella sp.]|nr:hypothetical protein [Prevotella sp.]
MTATIKLRTMLGQFKCIDAYREIQYATRQLIGGLWYLYNHSGYVIGTFADEDIEFNN